jgi:uncharacterized membrane protein
MTTGGRVFLGLLLLLFLVLVVVGFLWLVRTLFGHNPAAESSEATTSLPTAREILDRRLASGDIEAEEYKRSRALIENTENSP